MDCPATMVTPPTDSNGALYRPAFASAKILGVRFDVCDYAGVLAWLKDQPDSADQRARYVCVSNVADVMSAKADQGYRDALAASDLTVPDGAPVVWAMRDYGYNIHERVYGPTLMRLALEDDVIASSRHLLIGGSEQARAGVRERFPRVNWVGEIDFRFDDLDEGAYQKHADTYRGLVVDFAWISLGGGKQVKFMHRFGPLLPGGTLLGVGAAFDFHAGLLSQAPEWMQRRGLEWLYRLAAEPRRLWHRYLILNPPFLWGWFRERSSFR
jgi:N-acetylglucosaminyldiphosphoundecaprenol N-acetyl-beta-D-mannosaminyltransferase